MSMFQVGSMANATQAAKTTMPAKSAQGFFSAGNQFGATASQAYQNAADFFQNNQPTYNNVPALPGVNDFSADRKRIEDALYNRAQTRLDTQWGQDAQAFEQRMANEGVDVGTPRYMREKEAFERARGEAYNDAQFRAMTDGGNEQSRLFGLALQARQQGVSEADNLRTARINELAALVNPAMDSEKLINEKSIADQNNATSRYNVDKSFESATADRASREKLQGNELKWRGKQNNLDRAIERSKVSRMGGGGDGSFDLNAFITVVEKLLGEKLTS